MSLNSEKTKETDSKGDDPSKGMPMKQTTFTILLLSLTLWGCSETSSTKSSSNNNNPYTACTVDYYTNPACPGYTGSTTGSTSGSTTGSTTGGTTGGGSGGSYGTITSDNSWTALYNSTGKPTVPAVSCSSPTGTGFNTRKGTITMAFQKDTAGPADDYSPATPGISSYTNNISSFLTNTNDAKMFIESDGQLKVRFMPRPQPKPSSGSVYCFGRRTGAGSGTDYGYSKLSFAVSVRAVNGDGSLGGHQGTQYFTQNINSCSPAVDFSGYAQSAPNGIVHVVHDVYSDQSCAYYPCNGWSQTTTTCWQMDVEAAVDGTKTF